MNDFDPLELAGLDESAASSASDKAERKRHERYDESRRLDPWERYRVLTDMSKIQLDMLEMADRRTRFALLILGTLNALNILLVARPDLLGASGIRIDPLPGVAVYLISYALISIFLFVQAVIALKPRATPLLNKEEGPDRRLRHFGAMLSQTPEEYLQGWREATVFNVNQELAVHVQLSARVAAAKYVAISRLYTGLMVLVCLTSGMLLTIVLRVAIWPGV